MPPSSVARVTRLLTSLLLAFALTLANQVVRAAVEARDGKDSPPSYGIIEAQARTLVDKQQRIVTLDRLDVVRSDFPSMPQKAAAWAQLIETDNAQRRRTIALDRLEAALEISAAESVATGPPLRNDPPQLIFATKPAVLLLIDGEPTWRSLAETGYERIINTRALLVRRKGGPPLPEDLRRLDDLCFPRPERERESLGRGRAAGEGSRRDAGRWRAPGMSRTSRGRWLETAAWTAGTLLIATYAGTRWWYAHGRDEGVAAFEAARSEMQRSPSRSATFELAADPVDMSTWSPERVERYRESARAAAVPQALLRIPAVKLAVPVFDGTSDQNLNRGAGRIEGTAQIGWPGNVGIAAHRDGFFRVLKNVRVGDLLLLERVTAIDTYRVVSTAVVDPSEVSVLEPTSSRSVTLVTCYPFYYIGSAPRRFIVHAQFMTPKKTPAGEAPAGVESRIAIRGSEGTLSDGFDTTSAAHPRRASESR